VSALLNLVKGLKSRSILNINRDRKQRSVTGTWRRVLPKRSPLDFLFFLGAFLAVESFASGQWILLIDGIELVIFGVPISSIQNMLMAAGLALVIGSLACMAMVLSNGGGKLPSIGLFSDFMVIIGSFLLVVATSISEAMCLGGCKPVEVDMTYSFAFNGIALCVAGSYSWWREGMKGRYALHWEMLSTLSIATLLIDLFALSWGGVSLPVHLTLANYLLGVLSVAGLVVGVRGVISADKVEEEQLSNPSPEEAVMEQTPDDSMSISFG
jgi:hypothetical protein